MRTIRAFHRTRTYGSAVRLATNQSTFTPSDPRGGVTGIDQSRSQLGGVNRGRVNDPTIESARGIPEKEMTMGDSTQSNVSGGSDRRMDKEATQSQRANDAFGAQSSSRFGGEFGINQASADQQYQRPATSVATPSSATPAASDASRRPAAANWVADTKEQVKSAVDYVKGVAGNVTASIATAASSFKDTVTSPMATTSIPPGSPMHISYIIPHSSDVFGQAAASTVASSDHSYTGRRDSPEERKVAAWEANHFEASTRPVEHEKYRSLGGVPHVENPRPASATASAPGTQSGVSSQSTPDTGATASDKAPTHMPVDPSHTEHKF